MELVCRIVQKSGCGVWARHRMWVDLHAPSSVRALACALANLAVIIVTSSMMNPQYLYQDLNGTFDLRVETTDPQKYCREALMHKRVMDRRCT